jgi:hypothetical protein
MSRDDELTPREREALKALPRERMPGRLLEERTVQALRQRGLLRARRSWTPVRVGMAMAAGLMCADDTAAGVEGITPLRRGSTGGLGLHLRHEHAGSDAGLHAERRVRTRS